MSGQLSVVSDVHATAGGIPAQADLRSPRVVTGRAFERWQVALCAGLCAELRARAEVLQDSKEPGNWRLAQVERDRALLWLDLSQRIADRTAGAEDPENPARFSHRDVELIRWFRLVQLRQLRLSPPLNKQRCLQLDVLFHSVYAALIPRERAAVNREMLP